MANRKNVKKYYFSVEGETEYWYLKWLQELLNSCEEAACKVSLNCSVEKDPLKYVKSLQIVSRTEVYHLSDYESDEPIHVTQFLTTMDRMKKAEKLKQIDYRFGYSNLTFDLWMVLHKQDYSATCTHRKQYVNFINSAYGEHFENMDQYKHENNFKRCLKQLTLSDVILAVERSKKIMERNQKNGYVLQRYKGYTYYKENPSLEIWKAIEKILIDCGLLKKEKKKRR